MTLHKTSHTCIECNKIQVPEWRRSAEMYMRTHTHTHTHKRSLSPTNFRINKSTSYIRDNGHDRRNQYTCVSTLHRGCRFCVARFMSVKHKSCISLWALTYTNLTELSPKRKKESKRLNFSNE